MTNDDIEHMARKAGVTVEQMKAVIQATQEYEQAQRDKHRARREAAARRRDQLDRWR